MPQGVSDAQSNTRSRFVQLTPLTLRLSPLCIHRRVFRSFYLSISPAWLFNNSGTSNPASTGGPRRSYGIRFLLARDRQQAPCRRGLGLRHESAQGLTTVVLYQQSPACRPQVARPIRVFAKSGNGCHPLFNARHPLNCCGETAEGPAERRDKLITLLENSRSLLKPKVAAKSELSF